MVSRHHHSNTGVVARTNGRVFKPGDGIDIVGVKFKYQINYFEPSFKSYKLCDHNAYIT